jgi:hypothetical protein
MLLPADASDGRRKDTVVLMPEGLQHSKFTVCKGGNAMHVLCNKDIVSNLKTLSSKMPFITPHMIHPRLTDQVAHLLRLRVLQELDLLGDSLKRARKRPGSKVIRRLTREEWLAFRETGNLEQPNGVAVIVVPPLQKDANSGKYPEPNMSAAFIGGGVLPPATFELNVPLSSTHSTSLESTGDENTLPPPKIPLYHGVPLFPDRSQRAALHDLLLRLLAYDQRVKGPPQVMASNKSSHAFLLMAEPENITRGDAAAVAIALWRLRIFHGV